MITNFAKLLPRCGIFLRALTGKIIAKSSLEPLFLAAT